MTAARAPARKPNTASTGDEGERLLLLPPEAGASRPRRVAELGSAHERHGGCVAAGFRRERPRRRACEMAPSAAKRRYAEIGPRVPILFARPKFTLAPAVSPRVTVSGHVDVLSGPVQTIIPCRPLRNPAIKHHSAESLIAQLRFTLIWKRSPTRKEPPMSPNHPTATTTRLARCRHLQWPRGRRLKWPHLASVVCVVDVA